jgi:hypothetical protein
MDCQFLSSNASSYLFYLYPCPFRKFVVTSTWPGFHICILNDRGIMEMMFSREDLQQFGLVQFLAGLPIPWA